jgi:ankyrin repeat protein
VNSTTEGGETPLLMAAGNNHKKVVKILLRHDADVTAASAGFTALRIATLQGYTEIVQLLHQHAQQTAGGGGAPSSALSLAAASSLMPA